MTHTSQAITTSERREPTAVLSGISGGAEGSALGQSSRPELSAEAIDALLEEASDAPNRWYRYRVARWLLPLAMRTPVTPNQVTVMHAACGIAAGYFIARGSYQDLVLAFLFAELRMILDCLDGVVARAKKMLSPNGRTIDELGDMIGYIGLQAGAFYHLYTRHPEEHAFALAFGGLVTPALMAVGYDFYKRTFSSALRTASDGVADEVVRKCVHFAQNGGGFVVRFGLFFDWFQVLLLAPRSRPVILARVAKELGKPGAEAAGGGAAAILQIREGAYSGELRSTLRLLSWMTGDNAITVMNFGLLTGLIAATEKAVMATGVAFAIMGAVACQRFIRARASAERAS